MSTRQRGFTLLEMSITLLIVGILLTGLIMTLSAQQDATREAETRRQLAQAREALYGFAMINGRLPCPASPTLASTAANAGLELYSAGIGCTGVAAGGSGVLPWADLGLAETDPYGNRITYRVSPDFTVDPEAPPVNHFACLSVPPSPPTPPPTPRSAFALCHVGAFQVDSLGGSPALAVELPAVLVSHGPNGAGAYSTSGIQNPNGSADEIENSDLNNQYRYGPRRDDFDDEVEWIVPSILMHRMVQAGRLP